MIARTRAELRNEAEVQLANFLPGEFRNMSVSRVVKSGDPATEIVEYAHSKRASLIVVPTHGYGPFRRFLLGSVAAKILHDADCPVFTGVHIPETPPDESHSFRKIVCAVDFCPQSEKALEWASGFADEFRAQLIVVHITPTLDASSVAYFDPNWRDQLAETAREKVAAMQKRIGAKAEVVIDDNDRIPQGVSLAASQLEANLVVIGRGASGGVLGRLRTNAYSIIRQSPCPVVSV
jgi:nucleotide-binding universal stress UspA family protein